VNIYADFMEICANVKERTPISAMLLVGRWDSLSIEVRECNCDQGGKKVRYYRRELQMCENVAFRFRGKRLVLNFTFISNTI